MANCEKESAIMKYAVNEEELMQLRKEKEMMEKRVKDLSKDIEDERNKYKKLTDDITAINILLVTKVIQKILESAIMKYAVNEIELMQLRKEKEMMEKRVKDLSKDIEKERNKYKKLTDDNTALNILLDTKKSEIASALIVNENLREELPCKDIQTKLIEEQLRTEILQLKNNEEKYLEDVKQYEDKIKLLEQTLQERNDSEETNGLVEDDGDIDGTKQENLMQELKESDDTAMKLIAENSSLLFQDFDLFVSCYEKDGHPHKVEKLGLDLDDGTIQSDQKEANPQEARKLSTQRCIQSLVHACQCRDANCRLPSCSHMRKHTKTCKIKISGNCPVCKQLIALCFYHAEHCQDAKCVLPICSNLKEKMKQQQLQARLLQAQLLRSLNSLISCSSSSTVPHGSSSMSPSCNATSNSQPPMPQQHSPHAPGMGVKPGALTPPDNVFQIVKQFMVQEEAARQQAPHAPPSMGYLPVPGVMQSARMPRIPQMSGGGALTGPLSQAPFPFSLPSDLWKARYSSEVRQNAAYGYPPCGPSSSSSSSLPGSSVLNQQQQQQQQMSQHGTQMPQQNTLQHMQQQQQPIRQTWYQHNQVMGQQGFPGGSYGVSEQQRLPSVRGAYNQAYFSQNVDPLLYSFMHAQQQQQQQQTSQNADMKQAQPPFSSPQGLMGPLNNLGNTGLPSSATLAE